MEICTTKSTKDTKGLKFDDLSEDIQRNGFGQDYRINRISWRSVRLPASR